MFKKILCATAFLIIVFTFSACSKGSVDSIAINSLPSSSLESTDIEKTETIIIPKFIAKLTGVDFLSKASSLGIVEKQDDGSLVYRLTPKEKSDIEDEITFSLLEYLQSLDSGTEWPFIEKIEINEEFNHVTIVSSSYSADHDNKIAGTLYAPIVLCRALNELDTPENFTLSISILNKTDLTSIGEITYPENSSVSSDSSSPNSSSESRSESNVETNSDE